MLKQNTYRETGYAVRLRGRSDSIPLFIGQSQGIATRGFTGQKDSIPSGYRGNRAYAPAIKTGGLKGSVSSTATVSGSGVLNSLGDLAVTLPALTFEGTLEVRSGDLYIELPIPALSMAGQTGAIGDLVFDLPPLTFSGLAGGRLTITLPLPSVSGMVYVGEVGQLAVKLPCLTSEITAHLDGLGQLAVVLPALTMAASSIIQGVGSLSIVLPGLQFHSHILSGSAGQLNVILPGIRFASSGIIAGQGILSITLPAIRGTFHGQVPVTAIYRGMVLNTKNFAVTEYGEFEFNSLGFFDGRFIGANENGIYILGGGDNMGRPIEAHFKTGPIDFNRDLVKRPKDLWVSNRASDALKLTVQTDEGIEYEYDLAGRKNYLHEERTKIGRGLKGRFQSLGIRNVDGGDFDIDRISVLVDAIPGRKR